MHGRAEEYAKDHRESFDMVTARAVARANILNELCIPLVKVGGNFVSMKGKNAEEEINEGNSLSILASNCFSKSSGSAEKKSMPVIFSISSTETK